MVVGRTFVDLGGSDMIEPVALGRPTIIGPDTRHFQVIADDLVSAGGVRRCRSHELSEEVAELLADEGPRRTMIRNGRELIRSRQGATVRLGDLLRGLASEDSRIDTGSSSPASTSDKATRCPRHPKDPKTPSRSEPCTTDSARRGDRFPPT